MSVYLWIAILLAISVLSSENSVAVSERGRQTCSHMDKDVRCFYCRSRTCNCLTAPYGIISCINDNLTVLDCYCATYDSSSNELLQVGACNFNCKNEDQNGTVDILYHLPHDNEVCVSLNRTGALCGSCCEGHFVSAYSFDLHCMPCDNISTNWIWYIMAAYLPLTLFYFIVLFFKVNVASGYLHPVALFSQALIAPPFARIILQFVIRENSTILQFTKLFGSFYGIWSLDFFRPFYSHLCLGIGILPTLALDYFIAVYPLLLMIITYLLIVLYDRNYRVVTIMWRPFRFLFSLFRRNWDIRTSVVDAYATFFLLSYMKFLNTSFDLLAPTQVYHLNTYNYTHTWALYYAGDVEYFGSEHLPYGILAIVVLCMFVILPTVILALYPFAFFQKFLNRFPCRWHILHMFMDSFQGCYKNGTEPGTRDYRWFSAAYLVLRWVFVILFGLTLSAAFFPFVSLVIFFFIIFMAILQPYKTSLRSYFKINIAFLAVLATLCIASSGHTISGVLAHRFVNFFSVFAVLLGLLPLVFTIVLVFHCIVSRWKFFIELVFKCRSWCQCHKALDASAEAFDSDRVVNPQEYPAIPVRRYNSLVDLLKDGST